MRARVPAAARLSLPPASECRPPSQAPVRPRLCPFSRRRCLKRAGATVRGTTGRRCRRRATTRGRPRGPDGPDDARLDRRALPNSLRPAPRQRGDFGAPMNLKRKESRS